MAEADVAAQPIRVFLSYARADSAMADLVEARLTAAGLDVWRDVRRIQDTDVWAEAINRGLAACDRLIVLISKTSMTRQEVFVEWFYFYHHRKPLHCVLIETCEIDYHLLPYSYIDIREASQRPAALDRLVDSLRKPFTPPFQARQEVMVVSPYAPTQTLDEAFTSALKTLSGADGSIALTPEMATQIEERPPRNLSEYRLGRVAAWCKPRYRLDERFVRLSLLIDQGEEAQQRFTESRRFDNLRDVLSEVSDPALVLLGAPGAGKSTLLRRLELDTALAGLRAESEKVTFFASLAEYQPEKEGDPLPTPLDWLAGRWARRFPGLPSLRDMLDNRRMLLLLDALNEIPHANNAQYRERVGYWRDFLQHSIRDLPGNRVVFTCRTLDYSAPLSTEALRVPQVRVEAMDDERVQQFLRAYLLTPAEADAIWKQLKAEPSLLDLFRVPFFLKMLTDQAGAGGRIPQGRAQLFSAFVRQMIWREVNDHKNALLQPDSLLTERDYMRLNDPDTARRNPVYLPENGLLIPALTTLAYRMQDSTGKTEPMQVRLPYDQALQLMAVPPERRAAVLEAGCALTVLDEDRAFDQVLFFHQLLQEFFAARQLAAQPDPLKWRVEWREGRVAAVQYASDSEPLPPLPGTGWEETTVIAAGLAGDPEAFVRAVLAENLPLAARCAAQAEVRLSETLKDQIRQALIARTGDRTADLRARIAAGLALGNLGDPRFERRSGAYGDYLLPPLIPIPGGQYPIGRDDSSYDDEKPRHFVPLEAFHIGQFPVTNAEYKLFIEAGGYEDERWWSTAAGKAWRRGEGSSEGAKKQWRENRQTLQSQPDLPRQLLMQGRITSEQVEGFVQIAQMSDAAFEEQLNKWYPSGRMTQPDNWTDDAYNNPAQPVVGVCWYEAQAYCTWLSAQVEQLYRLPTEAEHEAASAGLEGRPYAYGDTFDSALCNTFESHIRRTTPVGVFPGGETPEGAVDLCGNTYDWTSSVFTPYLYDAQDGREDANRTDERRILRGGSWNNLQFDARAASRLNLTPDNRLNDFGFRVVVVGRPPSQ